MLLCRIVLQLPDRPGSLGLVTTLLGRLGVDIHQMVVRERDGERALDEFTAVVPGLVVYRSLAELLEEIDGVSVLEVTECERPAGLARPLVGSSRY
jgi:acetolactate synthase small subunit